MFCNKCGTKLPDNAQFCHNCGAKAFTEEKNPRITRSEPSPEEIRETPPQIYTQKNPTQQGAPPAFRGQYAGQSGPQTSYPMKQRPKWLLPLIAGASVMAALIIVIGIWTAIGGEKPEPTPASGSSAAEVPSSTPAAEEAEEDGFQRYENSAVKFAFNYPEDFDLSEPNANNVLLGKDDQCRVAVEYAYRTTKNCFIYSAEDFVRQIEADPTVLSGYLGAENVEAKSEGRVTTANGQERYDYSWTLSQNGKDYVGGLYIYDSQGDFGCYTFMWMVENGTDNTALFHEQINQKMLPSFKITGAYQAEGYTFYDEVVEGIPVRFALQDELVQEGTVGIRDDSSGVLEVRPVEGSSSRIYMTRYSDRASSDPEKDGLAKALNREMNVYLDKSQYYKDVQIISEPDRLELGRYPCVEVEMWGHYTGFGASYDDNIYKFLFPRDGTYWVVTMNATDELLDQTANLVVDFLMSLRFEDDGLELGEDAFGSLPDVDLGAGQPAAQADFNQVVDGILSKIEGSTGFMQADDYYKPLVSFTDMDGNGVHELLCLYKIEGDGAPLVVYDVYAVQADGSYSTLENRKELYLEVGGNSGCIGLAVDKAKTPYLVVETHTPQGDRFNNTITYIPWESGQTAFRDDWVYLESHGTYGEEEKGQYILGDTKVDKAAFDARQTEFMSLWTDLDLNKGPGNGGNNIDFAGIRKHFDLNTDYFGTA